MKSNREYSYIFSLRNGNEFRNDYGDQCNLSLSSLNKCKTFFNEINDKSKI